MHDAGTSFVPDVPEFVHVVQQGVDERAVGVAGRRVDDHARGLVDHHEVRVLEDDVERDRLRLETGGRWRRHVEIEHVTFADDSGRTGHGRARGIEHVAALDQSLQLRTRALRHEDGQRLVEAAALLGRQDHEVAGPAGGQGVVLWGVAVGPGSVWGARFRTHGSRLTVSWRSPLRE